MSTLILSASPISSRNAAARRNPHLRARAAGRRVDESAATPRPAVAAHPPRFTRQAWIIVLLLAAAVIVAHGVLFALFKHDAAIVEPRQPPLQIEVEIERPKPPEPKIEPPKPKVEPIKPKVESPKPQAPRPTPQPAATAPRPDAAPVQDAVPVPAAPVAGPAGPPGPVEPAPEAAPPPIIPPKGGAGYLNNPAPQYPEVAQERGWQGRVLLRVHVLANGRPDKVGVFQSSRYKALDDAAVKAVTGWLFTPAMRASTPVDGWVEVPIDFKL